MKKFSARLVMWWDLLLVLVSLALIGIGVSRLQARLAKDQVVVIQNDTIVGPPPPPVGLPLTQLYVDMFTGQPSVYDQPFQGLQ